MRRGFFVRGACCLWHELPEQGALNFALSSFALIALGMEASGASFDLATLDHLRVNLTSHIRHT